MNSFHKLMIATLTLVLVLFLCCFAVQASAEGGEMDITLVEQIDNGTQNMPEAPVVPQQNEEKAAEAVQDTKVPAKAITYTVAFLNWNDTELLTLTVNAGDTLNVPMLLNPTRDGFTFSHWADEASINQEAFIFGVAVNGNLVLKAIYTNDLVSEDDNVANEGDEEVEVDTPTALQNTSNNMLEVVIIDDEEGSATDELFDLEDDIVPLAGPALAQNSVQRSVRVTSNLGSSITENESITLKGELTGFDGCELNLQWQFNDGNGWTDLEGANEITYSFSANSGNINSAWRLAVCVVG